MDSLIEDRAGDLSPFLRKSFILFFGTLASFTVDQFTKFWVTATFKVDESMAVIPGIFSITLKMNPGSAFGFFRGKPLIFFMTVSIVAISFILYFVFKADARRHKLIWAMALILGGAVGNNLSDRLRMGSVVDFLDFHYRSLTWPTFNVADMSIVAGVLLFLLDMSRHDMRSDFADADRRQWGVNAFDPDRDTPGEAAK